MRRRTLGRLVCVLGLLAAGVARGASSEEPVSAFAASVGARATINEPTVGALLYVVPDGRTLLLTDILVANHGQETGPLYVNDSSGTRCAVELLQTTIINGGPGAFQTMSNVHTTFTTGIPFGPGERVVATLVGGTRGVDVTITGKLVAAPRSRPIRIPGGARDDPPAERRPESTDP